MSDWLANSRNRRVPTIGVAIALSLLLHVAVLWEWLPRLRLPSLEELARGKAHGSLVVQLAPPPSPPPAPRPAPALPAQSSPTLEARPPKATARPRPAPPVIAFNRAVPNIPSPPPSDSFVTAPTPARVPAEADLASYIEARRRARAESAPAASPGSASNAPAAEDDNARANRIAAANLGTQRTPTFGHDPTKGGVFQIVRVGYDNAEFIFFGWNNEIRRMMLEFFYVQRLPR